MAHLPDFIQVAQGLWLILYVHVWSLLQVSQSTRLDTKLRSSTSLVVLNRGAGGPFQGCHVTGTEVNEEAAVAGAHSLPATFSSQTPHAPPTNRGMSSRWDCLVAPLFVGGAYRIRPGRAVAKACAPSSALCTAQPEGLDWAEAVLDTAWLRVKYRDKHGRQNHPPSSLPSKSTGEFCPGHKTH